MARNLPAERRSTSAQRSRMLWRRIIWRWPLILIPLSKQAACHFVFSLMTTWWEKSIIWIYVNHNQSNFIQFHWILEDLASRSDYTQAPGVCSQGLAWQPPWSGDQSEQEEGLLCVLLMASSCWVCPENARFTHPPTPLLDVKRKQHSTDFFVGTFDTSVFLRAQQEHIPLMKWYDMP